MLKSKATPRPALAEPIGGSIGALALKMLPQLLSLRTCSKTRSHVIHPHHMYTKKLPNLYDVFVWNFSKPPLVKKGFVSHKHLITVLIFLLHCETPCGITFACQVNQERAQEDIVIMLSAVLFTRLSLTGDTPKRNKLQQKAGAQRALALIAQENCVIF